MMGNGQALSLLITMKQRIEKLEVRLEYHPTPDAESRLQAAFDMIWSKAAATDPQSRNLTETDTGHIMRHDNDC